jgi:hypothetical protein
VNEWRYRGPILFVVLIAAAYLVRSCIPRHECEPCERDSDCEGYLECRDTKDGVRLCADERTKQCKKEPVIIRPPRRPW